jgi:hypothetical protein
MKKRKRKIVRMHEGDDLVIYLRNGYPPIKLIMPRFLEYRVDYDPFPRAWVKFDCIDIKQYKAKGVK